MKHTPIGLVLSTCCALVILMHLYSRKENTSHNIQWKLKQTSMTQIPRSVYWQPLRTSLRWLKL